jgi:hypothetical protein
MNIYPSTTKLTTEKFIEKSIDIHKGKYNYTKSNYISGRTKIIINCPIHGDFLQLAKIHLNGHGCVKCGNLNKKPKPIKTIENFVNEANIVHYSKYDYSKSIYAGTKIPIEIICPTHNSFWQCPNNHLSGRGCKKCATTKISNILSKSPAQFITDAVSIHGSIYDYNLVKYISSHKKVTIVCKKHGSFIQKPSSHLSGNGCPICKISNGERIIQNFLIKNNIEYNHQFKIIECKDKISLPFDFAILKDAILVGLIEFQGSQHYISYEHFGGNNKLIYTQQHDKIKLDFCKNNNIPLSYKDKDKIDILLFKFLEENYLGKFARIV